MTYFQHDLKTIEDHLHHRPPYLMVDKILSVDADKIVTHKLLTGEEFFFAGHFPGAAVLPGAMMQEMCTQSAGALIASQYNPMREYNTHDPHFNELALGVLVKVKHARYRGFARPGDQLRIEVQLVETVGDVFEFAGKVMVEEAEALRKIAEIRFQLTNIPSNTLSGQAR